MKSARHSMHQSLDHHRVEHDREHRPDSLELAMAEAWVDENEKRDTLQQLMADQPDRWGSRQLRLLITKRDAAVAATVVQWLGTNVGQGFLEGAVERAGWRLLAPYTVQHMDDMRDRLGKIDVEIRAERSAVERVTQANRALDLQLQRREAALQERERTLAAKQANFLALLLTANLTLFRRTEPGRGKAKRRISADED